MSEENIVAANERLEAPQMLPTTDNNRVKLLLRSIYYKGMEIATLASTGVDYPLTDGQLLAITNQISNEAYDLKSEADEAHSLMLGVKPSQAE